MKLTLDTNTSQFAIKGHGPGFVVINEARHNSALIVMPDKLISPWQTPEFAALTPSDFDLVRELRPELVIFGSGPQFRFPDPRIMVSFSQSRIGFDVMDTAAACRTYNVLMSEGRRVAAALLI